MIDPVIFTIRIGGFEWAVRWYGVIVMVAVIVGSLLVERRLKRQGENSDLIWDALIWWVSFGPTIPTPVGRLRLGLPIGVLPAGILGARLWYVINATVGGSRYYLENPIQILNIPDGGLHIFGGFLLGGLSLLLFLRAYKLDPWLFLDAAGPAALIGQGIGRLANFINQELYGPPTDLPWGIPISAEHRLPQFQGLSATTRFHPTFAYEMLWNFVTAGILLWLSRRYEKQIKPGTIFAGWLIAAGVGRTWIELFFRPDQPKIGSTGISYSAIFAALMAILGVVLLLARYKKIDLKFAENWEEAYHVSERLNAEDGEDEAEEPAEEKQAPRARKTSPAKASASARGKLVKRSSVRRTTKATKNPTRATRAKKQSS